MSQEPVDPQLPLGRVGLEPDAVAPDGSQVRFSHRPAARRRPGQHGPRHAGCRSGLPSGLASHCRGNLVRPGRPRPSLAMPPRRRCGACAPGLRRPRRCPGHTHGLAVPVRRRTRRPAAVSVPHVPLPGPAPKKPNRPNTAASAPRLCDQAELSPNTPLIGNQRTTVIPSHEDHYIARA